MEGLAQQIPVVGFTYRRRKPQFLAIILCVQMEAALVNMNKCCVSASRKASGYSIKVAAGNI